MNRKPVGLTWSNLDFESELAGLPPMKAQAARWRWILRLLPQAREAYCLDPWEPGLPDSAGELLCWGVTPGTARVARQLHQPHPPLDVVRQVNSKCFSHDLECLLGVELQGSCRVDSLAGLEQAIESCGSDWVLKHPFGVSGRQRVLGKSGKLNDPARGWARRQLQEGWTLIFEPWVYERQDYSLHFEQEMDGSCHYLGSCQMVKDESGVFRGNRFLAGWTPPGDALSCAREVARRVADLGYWGPLGIDAFSGRPLVEINARYSFGRLTLALRDWIPPDWSLLWWHPKQPVAGLPPLTSSPRPGLYRLPLVADPEGTSGTVVAVAEDAGSLARQEVELGIADPGRG